MMYGITLLPLVEYLSDVDSTLLSIFYADDVEFGDLERQSAA